MFIISMRESSTNSLITFLLFSGIIRFTKGHHHSFDRSKQQDGEDDERQKSERSKTEKETQQEIKHEQRYYHGIWCEVT